MPSQSPPSPARLLFGQRVREVRRAQGLTLEALGEKCHLAWNYIGSVERGERNITVDNAAQIADGLRVPMAVLFTAEEAIHLERLNPAGR